MWKENLAWYFLRNAAKKKTKNKTKKNHYTFSFRFHFKNTFLHGNQPKQRWPCPLEWSNCNKHGYVVLPKWYLEPSFHPWNTLCIYHSPEVPWISAALLLFPPPYHCHFPSPKGNHSNGRQAPPDTLTLCFKCLLWSWFFPRPPMQGKEASWTWWEGFWKSRRRTSWEWWDILLSLWKMQWGRKNYIKFIIFVPWKTQF